MNYLVYKKGVHTFVFCFDLYPDLLEQLHSFVHNKELDFTNNDADYCLEQVFYKIGTF